jgi:hypothetical protein
VSKEPINYRNCIKEHIPHSSSKVTGFDLIGSLLSLSLIDPESAPVLIRMLPTHNKVPGESNLCWRECFAVVFLLLIHLGLGFVTDFANHARTQFVFEPMG